MPERQRILVVDDEERFRQSVRYLLEEKGFSVETAENGSRALSALRESYFDLILLDLQLPDLRGEQIMVQAKTLHPKTLVIILTGFGSIESAIGTMHGGAYDYIVKPFEPEHLLQRVINAFERRRLEEEKDRIAKELERSQRQYLYLVENSPDLIYTLDHEGKFSFVNTAFERLLGYSWNDIQGKHYSSIIHPNDLQKSLYVFNERRSRNRAATGVELHLLSAFPEGEAEPGEILPIELKAQGIYDQGPQMEQKVFLGTYGVARDIRERRLLEEHLQRAERLESLATLAGGIAHDFNNFLAAILGNISLMKLESPPSIEQSRRLTEMEKAVIRAKDLTRRLITFARGGSPIKRRGSLPDLVRDVCGFVLTGSKARCQFEFPQDLWELEFDPTQIGQVVQNLVLNASQAMPTGGTITIRGENATITSSFNLPLKPGRFVRISIQDTGNGIPSQLLDRVFEPYFTTRKKGIGLGLATSYAIMKHHGGYIDVDSEEGRGTTFFLYLPISANA